MQPVWRLVLDLDHQRTADHDRTGQHDDEDRRTIAGIDEGVVEAAALAGRRQRQEARIELALAAARTSAGEPAQRALQDGGLGLGGAGGLVHDKLIYHTSWRNLGSGKAK